MFRLTDSEQLDRTAIACAAAGAGCVAIGALLPFVEAAPWLRWTGPVVLAVAGTRGGLKDRIRAALLGGSALLTYVAFRGYPVFADVMAGALMGAAFIQDALRTATLE